MNGIGKREVLRALFPKGEGGDGKGVSAQQVSPK